MEREGNVLANQPVVGKPDRITLHRRAVLGRVVQPVKAIQDARIAASE